MPMDKYNPSGVYNRGVVILNVKWMIVLVCKHIKMYTKQIVK